MRPHPANRFSKFSPCGFIPAKTPLARPLMVRQPYCAAVKSDGEERLHPLSPEGKGCANERNESSLSNCRVQPTFSMRKGLGKSGGAFLKVKEGRVGSRKNNLNIIIEINE